MHQWLIKRANVEEKKENQNDRRRDNVKRRHEARRTISGLPVMPLA
jgi:hypothetical protein